MIERAVNDYATLQRTMAEGAGAAGLAAMLTDPERFRGRKVGLVLCGGNIDARLLASVMVRELERDDRIASFRITSNDRPGLLGILASRLGALGANILEVQPRPAVPRCSGQRRFHRRHYRNSRKTTYIRDLRGPGEGRSCPAADRPARVVGDGLLICEE